MLSCARIFATISTIIKSSSGAEENMSRSRRANESTSEPNLQNLVEQLPSMSKRAEILAKRSNQASDSARISCREPTIKKDQLVDSEWASATSWVEELKS